MKKIILTATMLFFVVPAVYLPLSYAQQTTDVEFMKASDYLALKELDPVIAAKILASGISPNQYIGLHPGTKDLIEVGDPKAPDKDFYIVMTDLGKTLAEKLKKGEPLVYPIDPAQYKPGKGLVPVQDVKEIPKPPAVTQPPLQTPSTKPVAPKLVKGELDEIYKSRDGKKYVMEYSIPDPANPGKMITKQIVLPAAPKLLGFEDLSDVDFGTLVYFQYTYNEKNEIIGVTIVNPEPPIVLKPLVVGGKTNPDKLRQETYVIDEARGLIVPKSSILDTRLVKGFFQPPADPPKTEKPVTPPVEEGKDYQAPSDVQKNWWDNILDLRKKPAADPIPTPPEAAAATTTADPKLPKGRQPRKPKASADPVAPPTAMPAEDVPGVITPPAPKRATLSDLDSWDPVTTPMPKIGEPKAKINKDGKTEYGAVVTGMPCTKDEKGNDVCPFIIGIGSSKEEAVADAQRQIDEHFANLKKKSP